MAQATAHRGIAYAVFEDLSLADYGNRIPSLTFEVEADEGAVPVAAIAAALGEGRIGGEGLASVDGYAAGGSDLEDALAPLRVLRGAEVKRSVEIVEPGWSYDAAMIFQDMAGTGAGECIVEIRQIGSRAMGRAAHVAIPV